MDAAAALCYPEGISEDATGNLYIADSSAVRIHEVTAAVTPPSVQTAAPTFSVSAETYASPQTVTLVDATLGAAIYITLNGLPPTSLVPGYSDPIDVTGSVTIQAIAEAPGYLPSAPVTAAYTITSAPAAVISTIAGNGVSGFSGAGGPVTGAEFGSVRGIAVDAFDNLYFSDSYDNVVWVVSAQTGAASIVAGNGQFDSSGDDGPATSAMLHSPEGIAVDGVGNFCIADTINNKIRKVVLSTGVITTVAGNGDGGPATSAELVFPAAVVVDGAGNLYIADTDVNRVRMVSVQTGIITTIAGNGTYGFSGDGGLATSANLEQPNKLALDSSGICTYRPILRAGFAKLKPRPASYTTIAGNGDSFGDSGDDGQALKAEITPNGLAVDIAGNLW